MKAKKYCLEITSFNRNRDLRQRIPNVLGSNKILLLNKCDLFSVNTQKNVCLQSMFCFVLKS